MKVKLEVTFETVRPMQQATGMKMWEIASHFMSVGASRYQLKSEGEAVSIPLAVDGIAGQIVQILQNDPNIDLWDDHLRFTKIVGEEISK